MNKRRNTRRSALKRVKWINVFGCIAAVALCVYLSQLVYPRARKRDIQQDLKKQKDISFSGGITENTEFESTTAELSYHVTDFVSESPDKSEDKSTNDSVMNIYLSEDVSESEKKSMFEFYSMEEARNYDTYYSARLNRTLSKFEMYHLVRIAYSESGNQCLLGKVAVVSTILNRLEDTSGAFPEERIYDIIFSPGQFSSAQILEENCAGKYFSGGMELLYSELDAGILEDCLTAVKRALDGEDPTSEIGGALFFYNPDECSMEELDLRSAIPADGIMVIEDHWFHREWPAPSDL